MRLMTGSPVGSLTGTNGHNHPATPSHTEPRNTCSEDTSSLVWHHMAILRLRLILEQVKLPSSWKQQSPNTKAKIIDMIFFEEGRGLDDDDPECPTP
jgi:hypothetical protein